LKQQKEKKIAVILQEDKNNTFKKACKLRGEVVLLSFSRDNFNYNILHKEI
jgi:hypothetical protein